MDRRSRVLANLDLQGWGLEIGGSYSPLAAGYPGLRVKTLDHLDQEALIRKYSREPVDVSRIQPVDYIWSGERYVDLVRDMRFDWIIASHVIEHVPDVAGFVNQCAEILTPGGVLSLVVPDKRFVFDYFRPPTGLAALVDAHLEARRITTAGNAVEHAVNHSHLEGASTWCAGTVGEPVPTNDFALARHVIEQIQRGEYVDVHAWVFTPHSFRLAIHDLHALGFMELREAFFQDTVGFEFFVQLSRAGSVTPDRQTLARRALEELTVLFPSAGPTIAELRAENAALSKALDDLRSSTSWRVTAPLRAVGRLARRG